jgi:hypothetical protein
LAKVHRMMFKNNIITVLCCIDFFWGGFVSLLFSCLV